MSDAPFLPERVAIDAYGNGGFRFRDLSHKGSLLCLPGGVYGWPPLNPQELQVSDFGQILDAPDNVGFVLLGTGDAQVQARLHLRKGVDDHSISVPEFFSRSPPHR